MVLAQPLYRFNESFFQTELRLPTKQLARFAIVRAQSVNLTIFRSHSLALADNRNLLAHGLENGLSKRSN
jgi:hypothetical protein